jgi:hypothetical protein
MTSHLSIQPDSAPAERKLVATFDEYIPTVEATASAQQASTEG